MRTLETMGFSTPAAESFARMTAFTLEQTAARPDNPVRGTLSLRDYIANLVARSAVVP